MTIFWQSVKLIGKTILLGILLFISSSLGWNLVNAFWPVGPIPQTPQESGSMMAAILSVCLLNAVVLAFASVQSRWTGWRFVGGVFLLHFGITTFLSQIESVVFLKYLVSLVTWEMIARVSLQGVIVSSLAAPLTAAVFGKLKRAEIPADASRSGERRPGKSFIGKLLIIGLTYAVIYFLFGYFVAWQSPAVRAYYHGLQAPAWIPLFQWGRGMIWGLLALIVTKMTQGPSWKSGLAAGLMFSLLMSSGLLIPNNPVMPTPVRLTHFVEITGSNLIFGGLAVAVWNWGRKRRVAPENLVEVT